MASCPKLMKCYYSGCTNRKAGVIINRPDLAHTRLTHAFRMENRPFSRMLTVWRESRNNSWTYFDWMRFHKEHSKLSLSCDWCKRTLQNFVIQENPWLFKDISLYSSLWILPRLLDARLKYLISSLLQECASGRELSLAMMLVHIGIFFSFWWCNYSLNCLKCDYVQSFWEILF